MATVNVSVPSRSITPSHPPPSLQPTSPRLCRVAAKFTYCLQANMILIVRIISVIGIRYWLNGRALGDLHRQYCRALEIRKINVFRACEWMEGIFWGKIEAPGLPFETVNVCQRRTETESFLVSSENGFRKYRREETFFSSFILRKIEFNVPIDRTFSVSILSYLYLFAFSITNIICFSVNE